jgi:HSP20 family molecular chaperone IbpA
MMKSQKAEPKVASPTTRMKLAAPDTLQRETREISRAIAQRAYELFAARNGEHGHDWEDWFQAESELLRPVSIALSESPNCLSIRVNIDGFSKNELRIGIEPKNITIFGKKDISTLSRQGSASSTPNQILRSIAITSEIDIAGATIELESGVLKLELPKVAKTRAEALAAGARTV